MVLTGSIPVYGFKVLKMICPKCKEEIAVLKDTFQHPLILDGKEFKLPSWNYGKQLEIVEQMKYWEKSFGKNKPSEDEKGRQFETLLILRGMKEIDSSFNEDTLRQMHPIDRIELFNAIYLSGKRGIVKLTTEDENFQKDKQNIKQ